MKFLKIFFGKVEEIEDIDGNSDNPLIADAIENEKDLLLSEEQKKIFRKVSQFCLVKLFFILRILLHGNICLVSSYIH